MPVDPETFRLLLGSFATGVTVLTTRHADGRPAGMTASAVAAVSLDPPLALVCVDRAADCHPVLQRAPGFALNVLAADQEHLSRRFAEDHPDRFDGVPYRHGPHDVPLLDGVLAHVTCDRWRELEAGDHTIFIGRVTGGRVAGGTPLLHYRGAYGRPE